MFKQIIYVLLIGLPLLATPLYSQTGFRPDSQELKLLPSYCQDKFGSVAAARERWKKLFGEEWMHMHHYCDGINHMNRATKVLDDRNKINYLAGVAIDNFEYMLKRAGEQWLLLPELHFRMGKAKLKMRGSFGEIAAHYEKAVLLKPDYVQAWAALSDLYLDLQDREKARAALENGLSHSPNSKILLRRKSKLGK